MSLDLKVRPLKSDFLDVKCPTSRMDCETDFLSILENFFQSGRIFGGTSISVIYNVLEAIT